MKVIILTLGMIGLMGCATARAWVIRSEPDGGVIGYTGATKDALPLIKPHVKAVCGKRKVTVTLDEYKTRDRQVSSMQYQTTTANTSGNVNGYGSNVGYDETTTKGGYVPVTTIQRESWREMTYQCN